MQDETYEQMSARIEQLETTVNAVGGVLRLMSYNQAIDDDVCSTLGLLADVLEHPEVLS